jgi:predicted RNase H-like HicB family nuclease
MAGYIALVHKDEGTSYGVSFPDVPSCIAAGDTFEEAVANVAEAPASHFAAMKADGDVIPRRVASNSLSTIPDSSKVAPTPS